MPEDAKPEDPAPQAADTPKSQHKRTSRACLVCRARKSKCTLDSGDGKPPCQRCRREDKECVIGSSNRGGRRVRRSTLTQVSPLSPPAPSSLGLAAVAHAWSVDSAASLLDQHGSHAGVPAGSANDFAHINAPQQADMAMQIDPALNDAAVSSHLSAPQRRDNKEPSRSSSDDNIPFNELQNPSDALDILAHIASNDGNQHQTRWNERRPQGLDRPSFTSANRKNEITFASDLDYHLTHTGALTSTRVWQLIERYQSYYHPYFPIVMPETFNRNSLQRIAREESHLLTAMLVIASKDLVDEPHIFAACSEHMQALVSGLAAGGASGVEAVEALLLLAEWAPYTFKSQAGEVGRGEEDREAWMHVGTALRIGYFLGLDKYSFRLPDNIKDTQTHRKRLVWTACYISDRQVSIRIGRGFWSRGPGPMTTLRKEDFPSLQPRGIGAEDHASIFQATLELTMLFSNVHDVLYSNPAGFRSHLSGGYIKYIDDFRSAIYGWNSVYGTLTCSPNLKATLLMSYDYLRLYTTSFATHQTLMRAMPETADGKPTFSRVFYNNVGAVGDARFIYEGLDAAKSLLTTMNNFVDAERSLRYMPLRFYLYTIYAGVFLYRARAVGIMSPDEEVSVQRMIQQTVTKLEQASVSDSHPGRRYSQLLKLLWEKSHRKGRKEQRSMASLQNPYRPGAVPTAQTPGAGSSMSGATESPAMGEQMGDFSWTDLDAIGNFALHGNEGLTADMTDWSGFLPAENNPFGGLTGMGTMDDWNLGQ